ncbi:MAG TPA: polysaccharide deacetylase family protein, partial [Anaerolineales bacterium]
APEQLPTGPGPIASGKVVAPILLYHHIAETRPASRYSVSPADFERQMKHLKSWGYTTISLGALSDALQGSGNLPERPLIITFDDGYQDVYQNAFPVMQQLGFTGVVYVITGQIKSNGTLNVDELKAMIAAGWEVGSHSRSHLDLRTTGLDLNAEIAGSREKLEKLLDTPVLTFSFPYGLTSPAATRLVRSSGYQTAVGVGGLFTHSEKMRYYLSRLEVQGGLGLPAFARLLPWSDANQPPIQPTN